MPNYFFFILLIIVSSLLFVYTIYKTKEKYIIAHFLVMSGLAFVLEYFVLIIGNGYKYYPNFIENAFYDSLLGSLVSQAVAIPIAATVIAAFRLNFLHMLAITAGFIAIETYFIHIEIYEQFWWETYFTAVLLPIYFLFGKFWLLLLQNVKHTIVHYTTLYFMTLTLNSVILFFLVLLLKTHELQVGWYDNPYRDHIAANSIYIIILSAIFSILILKKVRWYVYFIVLIGYNIIDHLMVWNGMLELANWWNVFYFSLLNLTDLLMVYFLNEYLKFKYFLFD
ncbi:hypothetical protein CIB95_07710 [Lottiidibacillus patelloidae]|uniref:Uncharacterized protein n=1 Tax=Lottiidibacillus patelloidae TaxID=2670334 RepID=A0A263BUD7_9BACI|nr:hypothetical protein [Lottiidibacillus patelloidae]OZM57339.1 hypothetical protein CIB95_07710 [Lottiidibacillus patelloidae]